MSKSNAYETALLTLEFNNTNIANVGDATGLRGSSTAGSFYVALHTADPGEAGDQTTNECSYTGYARVAVARTAGGWTISGDQVSNTATVSFPQNTGASQTATHFSIGVASSGASVIVRSGELLGIGIVVTVDAGTDTLTATSHGLTNGMAVRFRTTDGTIPGGLATGTQYFVIGATTNTFQLSTSVGGSAVNITDVGTGTHRVHRDGIIAIGTNITPQFLAGTLIASKED